MDQTSDDLQPKGPFNKGDSVPFDGEYVCSPCGYRHTYHQGEQFTECLSCMAGSPAGDEEFAEGLELWEKADPSYEKVVEKAEHEQE